MAGELNPEEQELVKSFMQELHKLQIEVEQNNSPVQWNTAVKFLMARKFDTARALELFRSHEMVSVWWQAMRQKEGIRPIDPYDESIRRELCSEKLTILPGRDVSGAAIALFTARLHHPSQTTHQAVLNTLIFQLDVILESLETQRNGLVFIYDMTNSKYSNFDYELSIKILSMLKGSYPARLKKVLIVTAPMWFRAPFKILRLFVKEKLRDRVYTVTVPQLSIHVELSSLPRRLGGTADPSHATWVSQCLRSIWHKSSVDDDDIIAYVAPIVSRPSISDGNRQSISSMSPSDAVWDNDALSAAFLASLDLGWDTPPTASTGDPNSPFWSSSPTSRKRSVDAVVNSDSSADSFVQNAGVVLRSPPASKHRPLCNSDGGESIHVADSNGMTVTELVEYIHSKGQSGLMEEYRLLKEEIPEGSFNCARMPANMSKNRYTDVLCLDQSRVVLHTVSGENSTDYINANFVDGYRQKSAYISTQEKTL